MSRALIICALLLIIPANGTAGEQTPAQTVIRLKVHPAAAPRPVLRYPLLPELREIQPGNAVLGYLKCFMEQQHFFFSKEMQEKRDKWEEMPLKDLPVQEVRAAGFTKNNPLFKQADYAARLDHADWQILPQLRTEGIGLLIPEVQQLRALAAAQEIRLRADIAARDFDDALTTVRSLLAMARHMGEHPTLIANLVGMAFITITAEQLDQMLQQPGCPNLYWALTDLPDPFIDLRRAVQGERMVMENELAKVLPGLEDSRPMTEAELEQTVSQINKLMKGIFGEKKSNLSAPLRDPRSWLITQAADEARVRSARRELVTYGLPRDRVERFPPLQVILLADRLTFEDMRDELFKLFALPYSQAERFNTVRHPGKAKPSLLGGLLPQAYKVRQAQARIQQRIGLLRCVEALRLHAAENDGRLPARLEEVKVPLPLDPVTGRAFVYRLEGGTAMLQPTPPTGQERNPGYNIRYEVTITR